MKTSIYFVLMVLMGTFAFSSCERDFDLVQDSQIETQAKACPPATFSVSPCDKGFKVSITFMGAPLGGNYSYTIKNILGVTVDSGTVAHGQNTNPVLAYCRNYTITFYDPCVGLYTSFTLKSDGCNNNFLC